MYFSITGPVFPPDSTISYLVSNQAQWGSCSLHPGRRVAPSAPKRFVICFIPFCQGSVGSKAWPQGSSVWREVQALGQPGSISALVLPSGGMAARHQKGVTAEQFFSSAFHLFRNNTPYMFQPQPGGPEDCSSGLLPLTNLV
ncbi:hypothetical protein CSKR_111965 [Clonorchis sinensis]|uniref:Uncharacterized protein n=1 Tax=Clonorchis sinensis TaxID=79923 RepID=A0A3R7CEW9_CLOSI|nr:hypothetical protein CSKR_111965 [Clonorchis sinensis]